MCATRAHSSLFSREIVTFKCLRLERDFTAFDLFSQTHFRTNRPVGAARMLFGENSSRDLCTLSDEGLSNGICLLLATVVSSITAIDIQTAELTMETEESVPWSGPPEIAADTLFGDLPFRPKEQHTLAASAISTTRAAANDGAEPSTKRHEGAVSMPPPVLIKTPGQANRRKKRLYTTFVPDAASFAPITTCATLHEEGSGIAQSLVFQIDEKAIGELPFDDFGDETVLRGIHSRGLSWSPISANGRGAGNGGDNLDADNRHKNDNRNYNDAYDHDHDILQTMYHSRTRHRGRSERKTVGPKGGAGHAAGPSGSTNPLPFRATKTMLGDVRVGKTRSKRQPFSPSPTKVQDQVHLLPSRRLLPSTNFLGGPRKSATATVSPSKASTMHWQSGRALLPQYSVITSDAICAAVCNLPGLMFVPTLLEASSLSSVPISSTPSPSSPASPSSARTSPFPSGEDDVATAAKAAFDYLGRLLAEPAVVRRCGRAALRRRLPTLLALLLSFPMRIYLCGGRPPDGRDIDGGDDGGGSSSSSSKVGGSGLGYGFAPDDQNSPAFWSRYGGAFSVWIGLPESPRVQHSAHPFGHNEHALQQLVTLFGLARKRFLEKTARDGEAGRAGSYEKDRTADNNKDTDEGDDNDSAYDNSNDIMMTDGDHNIPDQMGKGKTVERRPHPSQAQQRVSIAADSWLLFQESNGRGVDFDPEMLAELSIW